MKISRSPYVACAAALSLTMLCGCTSSFNSTRAMQSKPLPNGLVYYMPKRPIIIQIVVTSKTTTPKAKGKSKPKPVTERIETASLLTVPTMPDMSKAFVLTDQDNWVAENHPNITVSETGLLESANGEQKSGIDTILQNLATAAGDISAAISRAPFSKPTKSAALCEIGKTYYFQVDPKSLPADPKSEGPSLCGFIVKAAYKTDLSVMPGPNANAGNEKGVTNSDDPTKPITYSGIFYKTDIPYVLSLVPPASSGQQPTTFVASSPDDSPIAFLPIKKALFADNTVHLSLKDGMLTNFEQDNTGEAVSFFKIPADFINAYFTAISQVFPKLISDKSSETQLALADFQFNTCRKAVSAYPEKGTSDQQQTALAQIKAMCPALGSASSAN